MDIQSLLGLLLGFCAILGAHFLEGGEMIALINGPAFLIVVGGTLGAVLLGTPFSVFKQALRQLFWIVWPPNHMTEHGISKVVNWSQIARKEGLLGLESLLEHEHYPYSKKSLQLLVDGTEPNNIRAILEVEILNKEENDIRAAEIFEAMGGYSPTFGILGAVLGLIQVIGNLTEPSKLGAGIAVAFVATVYGVGFANMVYLPVATKIREVVRKESRYREMLMEGVVAIAEGQNPNNIELKLEGFNQE